MAEEDIGDWCEGVEKDSQVAWILCKNRGGKLKDACDDYHKAVKKKDTKNYDKLRKALKAALDSANEGKDEADELIKKSDDIIDILEKKYGKKKVDDLCKKAIDELDTAHDYQKDFKPIIDGAQKMYDKETL